MNQNNPDPHQKSIPGFVIPLWSQVAGLFLLAIAYWIAVRLGLLVVAQPEGIASVWPASGLALAILLLNPKPRWFVILAVIWVTNLIGNVMGGNSFFVSVGFAAANVIEAFLAAWVLTLLHPSRITFGNMLEILALFGVAILSNGITALIGAGVSSLAFGAKFLNSWLVWWTSDGLGMILVTPLIVTWVTDPKIFRSPSPRRIIEVILFFFVWLAFAWFLFGSFTVAEQPVLRSYMLFPFLIWFAFRYRPRGMTGALTLLSIIAIWNTMKGYGIFGFANQTMTQRLVGVQLLLSVLIFTGLLLSAIVAERRLSEATLKESEARYRNIYENVEDVIYRTNYYGVLTDISPSAERRFGYLSEEVIGKQVEEFFFSRQDYLELDSAMERSGGVNDFEVRLKRKDGSLLPTSITSRIVFDEQGLPVATEGVLRDITGRKQAEQIIVQENAQLEQRVEERTRELRAAQDKILRQEKLSVLGQLAGGVGHELRNPLAVINNAIYYLKLVQPDVDEKIKQYYGMIETETHTAEKIITDLLDFARTESVEQKNILVTDLVQAVLGRFIVPPSVEVALDLPADLPMVLADPQQMEQVLGNLTVNAVQAMIPHGSTKGISTPTRMTISARVVKQSMDLKPQEHMVAISVTDTGSGISPENMKKLFEPLFTTKIKGIGLGLAVSKKLVEANGGRIEVQSDPGKGSTFTLVLRSLDINNGE
jgi:PAS domain S-box-containing protein